MKITLPMMSGLLSLAVTGPSLAAIISVSPGITLLGSAPESVVPGALESSTSIYAFAEQQSYTLTGDLSVDELRSTSTVGSISSGTTVNSYFLHADPLGDTTVLEGDVVDMTGTITFSQRILGIIWSGTACNNCPPSSTYLDASDYLGLSATNYPTTVDQRLGRGAEVDDFYAFDGTQDFIAISADGFSLDVSLSTFPLRSDQVRIITSVVPLPLPVWLFASGLVALIGVARKR